MSASFGSESGKGGSQDFELNLASIIDCFTVLITFMLASASFLSIGILDAGVAAAGATQATDAKPPSVNVAVELGGGHKMTLKLTGKVQKSQEIFATSGSSSGSWDFDSLTKALADAKAKFPDVSAVTLSADTAIEYQEVVKSMEVIRKTVPVVLLGGF